jgi:hypothetical protein
VGAKSRCGHEEQGTGSEYGDRGSAVHCLGDQNTVGLNITNRLSVLFLSFILSESDLFLPNHRIC